MEEDCKSALIKDDVEVVLMRLERARDAIQEIRPILLNHIQKAQPRFPETEKIYVNFMKNFNHVKPNKVHKKSTETDPATLIAEATELLDKISTLVRSNKAKLLLASLSDQDIRMRSLRPLCTRDAKTKEDLSPEQDFYFQLADSDLV